MMESFKLIACVAIVIAAFGAFSVEAKEEPRILHFVPQPKQYSMHIREFHECVSCNTNDRARIDFSICLLGLPTEIRKLAKTCCRKSYSDQFCKMGAMGKVDFDAICTKPKNALEVERCVLKKINKKSYDVQEFKKCKRQILERYCTSSSSSK